MQSTSASATTLLLLQLSLLKSERAHADLLLQLQDLQRHLVILTIKSNKLQIQSAQSELRKLKNMHRGVLLDTEKRRVMERLGEVRRRVGEEREATKGIREEIGKVMHMRG